MNEVLKEERSMDFIEKNEKVIGSLESNFFDFYQKMAIIESTKDIVQLEDILKSSKICIYVDYKNAVFKKLAEIWTEKSVSLIIDHYNSSNHSYTVEETLKDLSSNLNLQEFILKKIDTVVNSDVFDKHTHCIWVLNSIARDIIESNTVLMLQSDFAKKFNV